MNWRERHILITGASSGIGQALALELANEGAHVSLLARRADRLVEVKAEVEKRGGVAATFPTNIQNEDDVRSSVGSAIEVFGPVDGLIVNAGIGGSVGPVEQLDVGQEASVIATNLVGAIYTVSSVLPSLLERGTGRIAVTSSIAGWKGLPGARAYSASKAGLSAYFEALRVELRRRGISVTIVHPGFVSTPFLSDPTKLPFVVPVERAATRIVRAMETGKPTVSFPLALTLPMRLARVLPSGVYDRLAERGDRYMAKIMGTKGSRKG